MRNVEIRGHIDFTDEGITTIFSEGDKVICCVKNGERYVGEIVTIGLWKESEELEPYQAICINTSKDTKSYSSEIVGLDDITYICKNPLADDVEERNIELNKVKNEILTTYPNVTEHMLERLWDFIELKICLNLLSKEID